MLILNSQLSSEYFTQLVPYKQQKNITYDTGNPYQTQKYTNRIPYKEQLKLATITDAPKEDIEEIQCIKKTGFIPGNASNIWRQRFSSNIQEYLYHNSAACTFSMVLDIIQKSGKKEETTKSLKEILLEKYQSLFESEINQQKILSIWGKEGKKMFVNKIRRNTIAIDAAILNEEYYLTNIDIWIIANHLDLPIILFNIRLADLNYENWTVNWLVLNQSADIRYFFIRPPIRYVPDIIPEYGVVTTPLMLSQVKGLENMVKTGLSDKTSEYAKNIISLDEYIRNYSTVVVAPSRLIEEP